MLTDLLVPTTFLGGSAHLHDLSGAFSLEEEGVGCHGMCQHPQSLPGEAKILIMMGLSSSLYSQL